jgi:hypothetical protein
MTAWTVGEVRKATRLARLTTPGVAPTATPAGTCSGPGPGGSIDQYAQRLGGSSLPPGRFRP